jgi:lipoprotein-anchoring transpeptidase ErfK/SrfK
MRVRALLAAAMFALALPAHAAAAPRCASIGAPTTKLAWRARLLGVTPARRYLARPATARIDPYDAASVLVLGARADARGRCWLRVRTPARPNSATVWISAARTRLRATPWRIEVDRSRRTVALLRSGRRVWRARAVVGTSGTPTPTGLFAVASVWRNPPSDFLGAWILALTAHSDVLKTFDGGDGRVALHGRGGASLRDPLGSASSHGCVRLRNADISRLVRLVGVAALPGTPVRIG